MKNLHKRVEILLVVNSVVLLVALTVEVVYGSPPGFSPWFLRLQLVACAIFLVGFVVEMMRAISPVKYLMRNIVYLVLSIPYLNIMALFTSTANRAAFLAAGLIPVLRALLALFIIVRWTIRGSQAKGLFYSYILGVVLFTHVSALIFYESERQINSGLSGFGDALWWAWMGLTTAGAEPMPISIAGRILAVILPLMGMMILPIFTGFLLTVERK